MFRLKILMISGVFYPKINGAVVAVSNMMDGLSLRGHTVALVTRREKGAQREELRGKSRVLRVGRPGFALSARISLAFFQFASGLRVSRADPPDIIHVHGFTSLLAGASLGIVLRRPVVVSFHGIQRLWSTQARWRRPLTLQFMFPFEKWLLRSASVIIAQSNLLKGVVVQIYRVPGEKVEVIPNPIDIHNFEYAPPQAGGPPVVLFVGSLMKVHGPDLFVESFPTVLRNHPDTKFLLVGRGPLKDSLERRIRELGLGGSVQIVDEVGDPKHLSEIYRSSRVVVIPLRYSGYILSLVGEEGMATGRPFVTTMTLDDELARFGTLEVGKNGPSLGEAISAILQWDDTRYDQVSKSARRFAEERFSLEAVGARLEAAYGAALLSFS